MASPKCPGGFIVRDGKTTRPPPVFGPNITDVSVPNTLIPEVNCMIYCDKTLRPVCGSNGKTYPNKCVFDGAKCKDNSIELAYEGLCLTPKIEKKCNKLKALGKCTQEKVLLGCKTICDKAKSNSVNPDDVEKNQAENESTETKELSSQESLGKALLLSE